MHATHAVAQYTVHNQVTGIGDSHDNHNIYNHQEVRPVAYSC